MASAPAMNVGMGGGCRVIEGAEGATRKKGRAVLHWMDLLDSSGLQVARHPRQLLPARRQHCRGDLGVLPPFRLFALRVEYLAFHELGEQAAFRQQLVVGALLGYAPAVDHEDSVAMADGR